MSTAFRRSSRRPTLRAAARPAASLAIALAMLGGAPLAPRSTALHAQQVPVPAGTGRVTGVVRGDDRQPVAGAQVLVAGTRIGTVTADDGRYTLVGVPAGAQTIRVQRIGFQPSQMLVQVTTDQLLTHDVQLVAAPTTLNAVVTVGYTDERRRDVTGAVSSVDGNDIRDQKVATVEEAIRGRVPGVQVTQGGEPGRPAQIVVRGQQTFGNPSPLYVIDGMYVGGVNPNLNPDDIESIEVLKDASAAAQYGAQASRGVIVIRTKKGRAGTNQISTNTYFGFQQVPRKLGLAGTAEWQSLMLQAYQNAGVPADSIPTGITQPSAISTDWEDEVFQGGAIQNYNLQVMGGTANASYLVSGSLTDQTGTIMNSRFRRASIRANTEARFGRFTVGENLAISQNNVRGLGGGGTALYPLIGAVMFLPTIAVRDTNNASGFGYGSAENPTFGVNPVGDLTLNTNDYRNNLALGNAYAEFRIVEGLRYRLNAGIDYNDSFNRHFRSIGQLRFRTSNAFASLRQERPNFTGTLVENLLNYDGAFGNGTHRLSAVAGLTTQRTNYQFLTAYRQGFSDERLQQIDAGEATGQTTGGFYLPSVLNSTLGRATYAFADRYLFTGSLRRDCSSRFSPGNRCGDFGAGSVGWVVSEEGFFRSIPVLGRASLLKLRASTGVLGDQNVGEFAYFAPVNTNINYIFNGTVNTGTIATRLVNTDLQWQSNRSTDYGIDVGLLDNSLTLTADYFRNDVSQLLVNVPIPSSLGSAGSPTVNAGAMRNAGFEFAAAHQLQRGLWQFNTNFNIATNANRVRSLGNGGQPIFSGSFGQARTAVGDPMGSWYVRRTCGIFQSDAEAAAHGSQPTARAGDVCYVDVNGDSTINDEGDRVVAGNGTPRLTGGLFFNTRYRDLDFGINLTGKYGYKIFNVVRFWTDRLDGPVGLRSGYQPWTPENRSTTNPIALVNNGAAAQRAADNNYALSDRWLESGSHTRIQNVVVGYVLPYNLVRNLGIGSQRPRVYLNIQNLHTFQSYTGWDPDVLGVGRTLSRGEDDGMTYPTPRTFTFGIDVQF